MDYLIGNRNWIIGNATIMAHKYHTDFGMTLLLIYLLFYGNGSYSINSRISKSS